MGSSSCRWLSCCYVADPSRHYGTHRTTCCISAIAAMAKASIYSSRSDNVGDFIQHRRLPFAAAKASFSRGNAARSALPPEQQHRQVPRSRIAAEPSRGEHVCGIRRPPTAGGICLAEQLTSYTRRGRSRFASRWGCRQRHCSSSSSSPLRHSSGQLPCSSATVVS